jgi:hypothetical protein
MITPSRILLSLAGVMALASSALAAEDGVQVTPANRIVVVDEGKSATVKLKVDGCKPTFSVESDNAKVVSVADPGTKAANSKSIKISAAKNTFGQQATVTITIEGTGSGCDDTTEIEIQVFVVMDRKHVEKAFKSGDKGTNIPGVNKVMASYKKAVKTAEKDFKNELKQILADMKKGELGVPNAEEGPGGGTSLNQHERAMIFMTLAYIGFVNTIYGLYWDYLPQMAFCGYNALFYYGFLPFVAFAAPVSMQPGGCGTWDSARLTTFAVLAASLAVMNLQVKKFMSSVEKEAKKSGDPLPSNTVDLEPDDPGDGGCTPITAKVPDRELNKQLEIQKLKSWNSILNGKNDRGRIVVMGQATGSTVTVELQLMDANGQPQGSPMSDTYDVDTGNCAYGAAWPEFSSEGNLAPGTYRVTVTDADGNTQSQNITVPTS